MSEEYYTEVCEEMLGIIAAYAEMSAEKTGRSNFADRVMSAMRRVPRHEFVPAELRPMAYVDSPLPIGFDKTISQPFIDRVVQALLHRDPHDQSEHQQSGRKGRGIPQREANTDRARPPHAGGESRSE